MIQLFLGIASYSQGYDNLWLMGYQCCQPGFGGTNMDFFHDSLVVSQVNRNMSITGTNANITDSMGNLLFYTNGWYIANANNDTMLNGSGISPNMCSYSHRVLGEHIPQGAIILPFDRKSSLYYLLHVECDEGNTMLVQPTCFYYSVIDMSLDSGLGAVIIKSQILFYDTLATGQITSCRHANGRDWWTIVPRARSNMYYIILSTPYGITYSVQNIGYVNGIYDWSGQCVFAPDGNTYARFDKDNGLQLFDFDRCSGVFSNNRHFDPVDIDLQPAGCSGAAFSRSSRYLYLSYQTRLFQLDMYNPNLMSSKILIDVYDGYGNPFPTTFYQQKLANDDKIYMGSNNGTDKFHVINFPDSGGVACDFQQHSISLPTQNAATIATPPVFALGAAIGTLCDSLQTNIVPPLILKKIEVFPVPTKDLVYIYGLAAGSYNLSVKNLFGQTYSMNKINVSENYWQESLGKFPAGVYLLNLENEKESRVWKVIKE